MTPFPPFSHRAMPELVVLCDYCHAQAGWNSYPYGAKNQVLMLCDACVDELAKMRETLEARKVKELDGPDEHC